jgi:2-methylcitrate dehydratase PrpD
MDRREFLKSSSAAAFGLGMSAELLVQPTHAQAASEDDSQEDPSSNVALQLARMLNQTKYADLPPKAIEYAKVILASTIASAAFGSNIGSARIVRELAKEHGGKPESMIWFDGAKAPANEVARVNAILSDAAASDDSDIRNTAHAGTSLASAGLAIGERVGASGQDLLLAIVIGYEAAGRIGAARRGGQRNVHASQIVSFGAAVAAAKLLKCTDQQMAHAINLNAITMGGLGMGTESWSREYMGANAAYTGVNSALAASLGYEVLTNFLEGRGGFFATYGGDAKVGIEAVTHPVSEWEITKYLAVKLWPGAHPFSGTVEAAMNAAKKANVPPDQVDKILVSGTNGTSIQGSRRPANYSDAIHSLPYFVAAAVADKDFTWIHASPSKYTSPVIARLIDVVEADPAPPAVKYQWGWGGGVTIVTKSGARFFESVDAPRGSAARGIEWSDVDSKYHALVPESKMSTKRIEDSLTTIHGFDRVKKVSELTALLKA